MHRKNNHYMEEGSKLGFAQIEFRLVGKVISLRGNVGWLVGCTDVELNNKVWQVMKVWVSLVSRRQTRL